MNKYLYSAACLTFFLSLVNPTKAANDDSNADDSQAIQTVKVLRSYSLADMSNSDFEAFIHPETHEVFYGPRDLEAINIFLDKVSFMESFQRNQFDVLRNPQLVDFYAPLFREAIQKIKTQRLISEMDIHYIFAYFAVISDEEFVSSAWDWLSQELSLPYSLSLKNGKVVLSFLDGDFLKTVSRSRELEFLAKILGKGENTEVYWRTKEEFEIKLNLYSNIVSQTQAKIIPVNLETAKSMGFLDGAAEANLVNATELPVVVVVPPVGTEEFKRLYIDMLRGFFKLDSALSSEFIASIENFESSFKDRYGIYLDAMSLLGKNEEESMRILADIVGGSDISRAIEVKMRHSSSHRGNATALEANVFGKRHFRGRLEALEKTNKGIKVLDKLSSIEADYSTKVDEIENNAPHITPDNHIATRWHFLDKVALLKTMNQKITDLITPFKEKASKKKKTSPEQVAEQLKAMDDALLDLLPKKPIPKPQKRLTHQNDDDDDGEEYLSRFVPQQHSSGERSKQILSGFSKAKSVSEGASVSKNPQKRFAAAENAMLGSANSKKPEFIQRNKSRVSMRKEIDQNMVAFYQNLHEKTKDMGEAKKIDDSFFHEKEQPKYEKFKDALSQYGVYTYAHSKLNKEFFCWKIGGILSFVAVDKAHGTQSEKGNKASWLLRIYQKAKQTGLVVNK